MGRAVEWGPGLWGEIGTLVWGVLSPRVHSDTHVELSNGQMNLTREVWPRDSNLESSASRSRRRPRGRWRKETEQKRENRLGEGDGTCLSVAEVRACTHHTAGRAVGCSLRLLRSWLWPYDGC